MKLVQTSKEQQQSLELPTDDLRRRRSKRHYHRTLDCLADQPSVPVVRMDWLEHTGSTKRSPLLYPAILESLDSQAVSLDEPEHPLSQASSQLQIGQMYCKGRLHSRSFPQLLQPPVA